MRKSGKILIIEDNEASRELASFLCNLDTNATAKDPRGQITSETIVKCTEVAGIAESEQGT